MLLIITNSHDLTTDLLLPHLKDLPFFRFDIDRWTDFHWHVSATGFQLKDQHGGEIYESDISGVYLRKPIFPEGRGEDTLTRWCTGEVERLFEDLYNNFFSRGLLALVHPGQGKWFKTRQMRLASQYFKVPDWHIIRGGFAPELNTESWVVKTLTQEPVSEDKFLFVKSVEPKKLDPCYPWFLQKKQAAEEDVTVVYVRGQLFAYSLSRESFQGLDYRPYAVSEDLPWEKTSLTEAENAGIRSFMETTGYSFGRFDFLRHLGELYFLEMNPNGQWGWLEDPATEGGLFTSVAEAIMDVCKSNSTKPKDS